MARIKVLRNVMVAAVKPPNTPTMLRCQQISGGGWRSQEQASTSSREFMFAWAIFGGYILEEDMLLLLLPLPLWPVRGPSSSPC